MQIDRVNELLLENLAEAVNKEIFLPNALITLSFVDCDPDLKVARVGVSVLPDHLAGTTLRLLKSSTSQLTSFIKKRVKLRSIPFIVWEFDASEREAKRIEKIIDSIDNN